MSAPAPAAEVAPGPDRIRAEVERIVSAKGFVRSRNLCRFLRFVVEQGLDGDSERLKEYWIGVHIFGRGESFDPSADPIVRVQARRLRKKLHEYYDGEGREDPVWIEIPTGRYAPRFRAKPASLAERVHRSGDCAPSSIAVLPFLNMTPGAKNESFSDGLTEELIHALAKTPDLRVAARTSSFQFKGKSQDVRHIGAQLNVAMLVEGSIRREGDRVRVMVKLIDAVEGWHLWSGAYEQTVAGAFAVQQEIAALLATIIRTRR